MQVEAEIKVKVGDLHAVTRKVKALGGFFLYEEEHVDTYFNHPARDFKTTDEALRLRRAGSSIRLTYKGPKLSLKSKTRFELEVGVSSFEGVYEVLRALGFTVLATIKKKRQAFKLSDLNVYADEVEGLGSYVELEAIIPSREGVAKAEGLLLEAIRKLDLPFNEATTKSYLELYLEALSPR